MAIKNGLIMTIESDEEVEIEESDDDEELHTEKDGSENEDTDDDDGEAKKRSPSAKYKDELNPEFRFGDDDEVAPGTQQSWDFKGIMEKIAREDPNRANRTTTQQRIERVKQKKKERKEKKRQANELKANKEAEGDGAGSSGAEEEEEEEGSGEGDGSGSDDDSDLSGIEIVEDHGEVAEEDNKESSEESSSDEDDEDDNEETPDVKDQLRMLKTGEDTEESNRQKKKKAALTSSANHEEETTMIPEIDEDPEAKAFFEAGEAAGRAGPMVEVFDQLNLSRPLLRAVAALGFTKPTPIQGCVIPLALAGRDVCASAATGSGKTAAFGLPLLERLLYRPRQVRATRVLVVAPTRELAAQGFSMLQTLGQHTDTECALVVGGSKNLRAQEAELRGRPDVVVATPGRLVDHLTNSRGFHLDDVEILVLDEVDRLMELGFQDEVEEIIRACPRAPRRQTLLFSATMGMQVEQLVSLSLHKPVRVKVDDSRQVAGRLVQEFIRIKKSQEDNREAIMAALLARTFRREVIVFFDTKTHVHRFAIVLGLLGLNAVEMHGNLTQAQRLDALEKFKNGEADILLCTDVAARGLDIVGVKTVINYDIPRSRPTYIHRVGRTARAGASGRSVTLVGEQRRPVMKEVLRAHAGGRDGTMKSRSVPEAVVTHFKKKISSLAKDVKAVYQEEDLEKELRAAGEEADRAKNLVAHADAIAARPRREWIQSEGRREAVRAQSKEAAAAMLNRDMAKLNEIQKGSQDQPQNINKKQNVQEKEASDDKDKRLHRQNRKKKRRALARAADEEEAARDRAEGRKAVTERSMRLDVKRFKRDEARARKEAEDRPAGQMRGAKRSMQVSSAFDQDLRDARQHGNQAKEGSSKQPVKKKSKYEFKEFDPNMRMRKGGKLSSNAFKSKKKYQRRKRK